MKETDLTQGKIFQKLIKFSLPMIAGNLLQQIYNLVDTLIVGRCLGADALAAVGSAYTLMIFITSIIIGLCMGSGAFFSEDYGAGNQKKLKEDIWLSFWFILSVSVVICAIIYPGMNFILWILQTPKELMELTREYVTVVFVGIIFVFLYNRPILNISVYPTIKISRFYAIFQPFLIVLFSNLKTPKSSLFQAFFTLLLLYLSQQNYALNVAWVFWKVVENILTKILKGAKAKAMHP